MHGGTFICDKCGSSMTHLSSNNDGRLPCLGCDGWMHLIEEPEQHGIYKKPNILWLGFAHVIWFFLKPISTWLDNHTPDDDHE